MASGAGSANLANFSPDGRYVMTSSDDHLTRVWEAATGKLVSTISHPDYVRAAAFSPDSGQVVTLSQVKEPFGAGYGKRLLRVSEALTGKSLLAATNPSSWRLSPNGKWVAGRGEQIRLPLGTKMTIREAAEFDRSNRTALATFIIRDTATGRQVTILKGHTEEIHSADFSPDSTQIATGSDDHTARIWDVASGRELFSLVHTTRVTRVAFSPDGQRIVTRTAPVEVKTNPVFSSTLTNLLVELPTNRFTTIIEVPGAASTFWLWDAATRRKIATLASAVSILDLGFSADSQQLLVNPGENSVQTFNARTGQAIHVFKGHSGLIHQGVFFPDGKRLLTASADRTAKLWDAETGRELLSLPHSAEVTTVAISPDGKRLVTGADDGTTTLWSAADWKETENLGD